MFLAVTRQDQRVRVSMKLRPQPLDDDAFAPYGRLIGWQRQGEPDFINEGGTAGWRLRLKIAKPLYMVLRTLPGTRIVTKLERHLNVAQTFLPLGGSKAALVVARPTRDDELPKAEDAAAFLLDGSVGYALHIGTWHSLDRLPVSEAATLWFMITDSDTQADLASVPMGTAVHTEMIHLPTVWGCPIEIDI